MIPLVSVIIPAYKNEYICSAIDSVLAQTYKKFEIIVVDDGSPNRLKEVLHSYIEQGKIQYIYQENKRIAGAKNTGIRHSKGELLAFLDDDDCWLPTKLEKQVCLFDESKVGICYTWAKSFRNENFQILNEMSYTSFSITRPELEHFLLGELYFADSTVIIRRECIEKVGYFNESPEYYGIDDSDMWIRILRYYAVRCVPETLMLYRLHPAQVSKNAVAMLQRAMNMRSQHIRSFNYPKHFETNQKAISYFHIGYEYLLLYKKFPAFYSYCLAYYYHPQWKIIFAILKLLVPFFLMNFFKKLLKIQ